MLKDFESEAKHKDILRQTRSQWHIKNQKILEKVEAMKEKRESNLAEKRIALLKEIKSREAGINKKLKENKISQQDERQKCIERIIKKEQKVKEKNDRKLFLEEKIRMNNEMNTFNRLKTFMERNENIKRLSHEKCVTKIASSEVRHINNLKAELEKKEKRILDNDEKLFNRYIKRYWNKRKAESEKKAANQLKRKKYQEKYGRLEEIYRAEENKKNKLIKRLQTAENTKRKNKIYLEIEKITKIKNKREEYHKYCLTNRDMLRTEANSEREEILEKENFLIDRNRQKNFMNQNLQKNAIEKTVLAQMNFERNLKPFYKELEKIKEGSILKKSLEDRRKIYRDIKKEEAEQRRKKREEELEKMNYMK